MDLENKGVNVASPQQQYKNVLEMALYNKKSVKHMSSLPFFSQHYGLREGKLHIILAPTDSGKSTLVRTVLLDHLVSNQEMKILLYLSEESTIDFRVEMLQIIKDIQKESPVKAQKLDRLFTDNLVIYSEQDKGVKTRNASTMISDLALMVDMNKPDLLVFDNITTSAMYVDTALSNQSLIAQKLKKIAQDFELPVLLVAHMSKGVTVGRDGEPAKDAIRGGGTIMNLAEFSYVIMMIQIGEKKHTFLRSDKARGYDKKSQYFSLDYNHMMQIYQSCIPVHFENFKAKFLARNTLKQDKKKN